MDTVESRERVVTNLLISIIYAGVPGGGDTTQETTAMLFAYTNATLLLTFSSGHFIAEGSGQKQPLQFPTFFV